MQSPVTGFVWKNSLRAEGFWIARSTVCMKFAGFILPRRMGTESRKKISHFENRCPDGYFINREGKDGMSC